LASLGGPRDAVKTRVAVDRYPSRPDVFLYIMCVFLMNTNATRFKALGGISYERCVYNIIIYNILHGSLTVSSFIFSCGTSSIPVSLALLTRLRIVDSMPDL
jgi:hypothetical protein